MSWKANKYRRFEPKKKRIKPRWKMIYKDQPSRNRHHLTPRSRGGTNAQDNLLLMHQERHYHWHMVFGNMTLDEAIGLLQRMKQMKTRTKERKAA